MLKLYNNSFSGELPMSSSSCERLTFLDLGENKLTGNIPASLGGNISQLRILSLRSNNFLGTLPLHLSWLSKLQVLDLSKNMLFGNIPSCLSNLSAMVEKVPDLNDHVFVLGYNAEASFMSASYTDYSVIGWQRRELEFGRNLRLVKSIDISSNNLSEDVPNEITELFELVALNLSRNSLQGKVPEEIGQLKSILSFDLSRNKFSGEIPASLSQLSLLNYLDLSYKFSGKILSGIQLQSFDASKFIGNVELCGPPLASKCRVNESPPPNLGHEDNKKD